MAALRDPKLEKFARALYGNLIAGMKRSEAADLAADVAGYSGSSRGSNARKRANRADVKKRLAELRAPSDAKSAEQIAVTKEWGRQKLAAIAGVPLVPAKVKPVDQIAALRALADIEGWKSPDQVDATLTVVIKGGLPEEAVGKPA